MTTEARPDVAAFLALLNSMPKVDFDTVTAETMRTMNITMISMAEVERGPLAVVKDLSIPGPAGTIPARLYDSRESRSPGPVMVFYHGGGFVIGDLNTYDSYCAEAARTLDMPVISIDYRLAPEHPWPAAPDDCEAATRWIAENIPCTGLITSGDSAGGNLCIVTTMALRDNPAAVPVIAQFPIYPVVADHNDWQSYRDHNEGKLLTVEVMDWFMQCYAAEGTSRRTAPLAYDHTGMPPTVVITATFDPLLDQGRAYAEALEAAGVPTVYLEAEGNIHGCFQLRKAIPSTAGDVARALSALKEMVAVDA
jgi:acetyl esterase